MKINILIAALVCLFSSIQAKEAAPALVPQPHNLELKGGHFTLNNSSRILFETRDSDGLEGSLKPLAKVLASELELVTGQRPAIIKLAETDAADGDILLRFDAITERPATEDLQIQSYTLGVTPKQITVRSPFYKGVAYGTATLLQLLDGDNVPCVSINDQPDASYRAVMIDVARQVHSLDVIRDVIRMCRIYKVRYLHLHLTDDQHFTFPFPAITDNLKGNFTYTRQELLDLVAYADARGVTIIPEMDLPGHSTRLKQSGYLVKSANDFEVASPENYDKIGAVIDDMLTVFESSPYFHIGGDESGAGNALVPFLKAVNERVRKNGRRLLVWEGFHGAPIDDIPATGDDRVIVMSWESSYNAPWHLLDAGYTVINASWRPTYVVGGGNPIHPGSGSGRKFPPSEIYHWDKDTFMHWEPGRPVWEDVGPKDPNRNDQEWSGTYIGKEDQLIGGQLLFWEQAQETVINDLAPRIGALSERLWHQKLGDNFEGFTRRDQEVQAKLMGIVQPVSMTMTANRQAASPMDAIYHAYEGEDTKVHLKNQTKIDGEIRFVDCSFSDNFTWIDFNNPKTAPADGKVYKNPLKRSGGFGFKAQLFRKDGTPVEGQTWACFNNWEPRVNVTEYKLSKRAKKTVGDLDAVADDKISNRYQLPSLRGPYDNTFIRSQKFESIFTPPKSGEFEISVKTQSGYASLYLDLNQNGEWEKNEKLITDTPDTEIAQTATVNLEVGEKLSLRVDHNTNIPRPVLMVNIKAPGQERPSDISEFLSLPPSK